MVLVRRDGERRRVICGVVRAGFAIGREAVAVADHEGAHRVLQHLDRVRARVRVRYSIFSSLRNREIETETLIFAPISLSYI